MESNLGKIIELLMEWVRDIAAGAAAMGVKVTLPVVAPPTDLASAVKLIYDLLLWLVDQYTVKILASIQ